MNINRLLVNKFGRRTAYRLGRALYMQARGDIANDMHTNGELMIQRRVIEAVQRSDSDRLVCFDVGANVGDWSAALLTNCRLSQYPSLELYVFEPVPSTAKVLKARIGGEKYIRYHQVALSSTDGAAVMYVGSECAGTNSLYCDPHNRTPDSIPIDTVTAATFCSQNNIDAIHLLKSDAEGHDMEIIIGALPLLKQKRIFVLQFEYNHRWIFSRHYLKDVFDLVAGLPYQVGRICPDGIELYDKWYPEHERFFEANYVLVSDDALPWFETRRCRLDISNTLAVAGGR